MVTWVPLAAVLYAEVMTGASTELDWEPPCSLPDWLLSLPDCVPALLLLEESVSKALSP